MRFDLTDLLVGVWKVLRRRELLTDGSERLRPDRLARGAVILIPIGAAVLVTISGSSLRSPAAIITGSAVLAGGFLTSFTYLSTLRDRVHERGVDGPERDLIDEVATLLLAATLVAVIETASLVVGMNIPKPVPEHASAAVMAAIEADSTITGPLAVLSTYLGALLAVLFVLTIPRLYNAYLQANRVRAALSGSIRHD